MASGTALILLLSYFGHYQPQPEPQPQSCTPLSNNLFASELSALVVNNKSAENVIYSPLSVHSSLALILMVAADHTESEIKNALKLVDETKESLTIKYGVFLNDTFKNQNDEQQLLISNGLFVNNKIEILKQFSNLASYYFKIQVENIDFSQAHRASEIINDWARYQTKGNIRDLIEPQSLSSNTNAVLVNAIYFKGNWKYAFNANNTKKRDFYLSPSNKVSVNTMFTVYNFRYAELPMLNAKALELPFKNFNISMLIILPNKIDGLEKLEMDLKGMDLNEITALMKTEYVNVYLPKFQIESLIDLKELLKKMGLSSLFKNANFSDMFVGASTQDISEVKQKTVITCNEEGAEVIPKFFSYKEMFPNFQKEFRADHPFVFVIRSEEVVYFFGHVAKFKRPIRIVL